MVGHAGNPAPGPSIPFADQTIAVSSPALVAVRSDSAAQKTTVEAAGQSLWLELKSVGPVLGGAVDIATGNLTGLHQRYMVYAKNGRLMKLDLTASGTPASTALTTLATNNICSPSYTFFNVAHDYADPSKSYLILYSPTPTGTCFSTGTDFRLDVLYRAVRMDMGPNDAPLTVPNPLAAIRAANGAITGFVVRNGARVQRTDANFANAVDLFAAPVGMISLGVFGTTAPGVWVYTDSSDLYAVDLANPTAPTPLGLAVNLALCLHQAVAVDGASMYVGCGPRLFRINQDRTGSLLGTASAAVQEVAVTPSRVVFKTNTTIASIAKSGGAITPLVTNLGTVDLFNALNRNGAIDPATGSSSNWQHSFVTGGENVYHVTRNGTPPNRNVVHVIGSDGTNPATTTGARVVSWTEAPAVQWSGNTGAHTVYMVEGENSPGTFSGSPVNAYDTTTRARRFVLGNFPAVLTLDVFNTPADPVAFGESGLLRALVTTLAPSFGYELFLFKSDTNGLTQATP